MNSDNINAIPAKEIPNPINKLIYLIIFDELFRPLPNTSIIFSNEYITIIRKYIQNTKIPIPIIS